ncbi:MAG TPA: ABC transporter substrate-binding protein [Bacillota bacterium]
MKSRLVRATAAVFILALVVGTAGCGGAKLTKPSVAVYTSTNQVVVFWDPSDSFSNEIIVLNNIYETLLRYDYKQKKTVPLLATGYQVSPDGLTWTFDLHKGVKFHTGNEMTADAVKYSFERCIKRGKGASFIWTPVKEIKVLNPYKLEIDLKFAAPLDLIVASGYGAHIFDPEVIKDNGEDWFEKGHEAGTGPYTLDSFKGKEEAILKKFDGYWGGWQGKHFDQLVFQQVSEASTKAQMLQSGQSDFVDQLPFEQIDQLKNDPNVTINVSPSYQSLFGLLNTKKAPLDNPLVRQAISYAMPYDEIVKGVMKGYATQSRGAVPNGLWGHDDNLFQYSYNLDKAKELLTKAGYPNGGLKLVLTYASGDEFERRIAELMKASFAKLNINLETRQMVWEPQWDLAKATDPKQRQDIFLFYWWPTYADPYDFLVNMFHTEDSINFNLSYYYNKELDRLVDEAHSLSGSDRAKAIQQYSQAQKLLIDDAASLFIYDQRYVRAIRSNLKGYTDNPAYPHVVFFYNTYREGK